jgi:uncharacterized cupin superfamily protein
MADERAQPVAIDAQSIPARTGSGYPEPFAQRVGARAKRALGDAFGLDGFGVNLTRLPPGTASALRHFHTHEDEFVYVLEGTPTLVTDIGEALLHPGMCAGFRAGNGDGHHLVNRSDADVVYLEVGGRLAPDAVTYPDDDLAGRTVDGQWRYFHKDGQPY